MNIPLNIWVYVTKADSVKRSNVCIPGRPDFDSIFEDILKQNAGGEKPAQGISSKLACCAADSVAQMQMSSCL